MQIKDDFELVFYQVLHDDLSFTNFSLALQYPHNSFPDSTHLQALQFKHCGTVSWDQNKKLDTKFKPIFIFPHLQISHCKKLFITCTLKTYYIGNTVTDFDIQRTVHRDIFL